ncbi:hypothetical protein FI667_g15914, partial [Globisporangium splendens]
MRMQPKTSSAACMSRRLHPIAIVAAVLLVLGFCVLFFEAASLDYAQAVVQSAEEMRKERLGAFRQHLGMLLDANDESLEPWMRESSDTEVPSDERLHLSLLQAACLENTASIVPWTYGKPGPDQENDEANRKTLISKDDPELLEKLRQCPDIDIFIPTGLRGHGYCEDAIVYAKFLESRLLPHWALEVQLFDANLNRTVTYHELCPKTPILLFNHYWDGVPDAPDFPKDKPVYLMPNVEMYELNEKYLWRIDVALCKTRTCYKRLVQWYAQEGNPRNTQVFYTRHTSSDVANYAHRKLGDDAIAKKDFENVRFIHTVGGSSHKGTREVIECWLSRPDFPRLDLFIAEGSYKSTYEAVYGKRIRASQINLTSHRIDPIPFGKTIAEASFFLCPSRMEGYGHYINQARASGGVIVTTNGFPMNELIEAPAMGVYVDTNRQKDSNMFLGGNYRGEHGLRNVEGMLAVSSGDSVCRAVEQVLFNTSVWQREAMAAAAQRQYHIDTRFFAREMRKLRKFINEVRKKLAH